MRSSIAIAAVLLVLSADRAAAQNSFPTPGGATVPGYVVMCVAAGVASPCSPVTAGPTPTASAGACVGGAVTGSSLAGTFTAPTCAGTNLVMTFAAGLATNGWACTLTDRTTAGTLKQTGSTATTATFAATTTTGDVIQYVCSGF